MNLQYNLYIAIIAVVLFTTGNVEPKVSGTFQIVHPSQLQHELYCEPRSIGLEASPEKSHLQCGTNCLMLDSQSLNCAGFTVLDQEECWVCFSTIATGRIVLSTMADTGQQFNETRASMYFRILLEDTHDHGYVTCRISYA